MNNKHQKRILMLMPYFGSWPDWFDLYLESCRWNSSINWIFFTDCQIPSESPCNVRFEKMTFDEYLAHASDILKLKIEWFDFYKICDLRPALGLLHQDLLTSYDYFGYGDIDVIYGNIRNIYTDSILEHLCISASRNQIAGHFSLFKNCELTKNAFQQIHDWRRLFRDPRHHRIDEIHFSRIFKARNPDNKSFLKPYRTNNYFVEQYASILADMRWINGSKQHPELWFWKNGRLTNALDGEREFLYLHFMNWKSAQWLPDFRGKTAAWAKLPSVNYVPKEKIKDGWIISRYGFHSLG